MEIRRLFYSIMRNWWLVALLALVGGGLGFLNVFLAKPVYQADATLYIMNRDKILTTGEPLSTQDLAVSQQLVQNYTEIIFSRAVASAVLRDLENYNLTREQLLASINLNSNKGSNILTISATADEPGLAAAIANAAAREFTDKIRQLTNSDNVGILDEAQVPEYPVGSNSLKKALIGLLAGLVAALGIIYVREYFDTTVRSAEDIENGLKVRVIGLIPEHDIQ